MIKSLTSDMEIHITTKKNTDLAKEQKDRDVTGKRNFLFNDCNINCGQFVEFVEFEVVYMKIVTINNNLKNKK